MTEHAIKRRARPDRRRHPTPIFSRYSVVGKRQGSRRGGEAPGTYVDRYSPRMMALLIAITENPGVSFVVWEASAFASPYTGSGSRYTFTTGVPVPAAVWLFGSGLGLLGWVRRRAAK